MCIYSLHKLGVNQNKKLKHEKFKNQETRKIFNNLLFHLKELEKEEQV